MFRLGVVGAIVLVAAVLAGSVSAAPSDDVFTVTNLVADTGSAAASVDGSLVNPWGLSAGPTTPWWTSNNGSNDSTLYSGSGAKQALTVAVAGGPTGTVFNGSATDFVVSQNGASGPARFLFATEAGAILGCRRKPSSRALRRSMTACMRATSTTAASMCSTPRSSR
jgi:uncharacterized protein (TIGR03118 family)